MSTRSAVYSAFEIRIRERSSFFCSALAGVVPVLSLALLWPYEEPRKLTSLAVAALVYLLGMLMLNMAQRLGIITDRGAWMRALAAKMVLSCLITQFLWVAPLEPNFLRAPQQHLGLQDANIYDYLGARIAEEGIAGNTHLLWFTWLSFGIVGYLSLIYGLFGISVLYVSLFNSLLCLAGVLGLTGTLGLLDGSKRHRWQALRFAILLPFGSYYDSTPSKEPLTHALFYCGLLIITRLLVRKGRTAVNVAALVAALGLLATVRLNVALLLLFANLIFFLRHLNPGKLIILFLAGVLSVSAAMLWVSPEADSLPSELFDLGRRFDYAESNLLHRAATGDTPLKLAVGGALTPSTPVDLVLLSPVRLAIWLFLPYPEIIPDFGKLAAMPEMLVYDRLGYFRFATELPAQLSAVLMIILLPYVLGGLRAAGKGWRNWYLSVNLLVPALVISNLMFIMGRRYRTLLEPLLVAVALWGIHHGRGGRMRYVLYSAFALGMVVASVY